MVCTYYTVVFAAILGCGYAKQIKYKDCGKCIEFWKVLTTLSLLLIFIIEHQIFYYFIWWLIVLLICAMSYKRVFGAKRRKVATRKPAKWWLFRVFAWRTFAPPHGSTRHSMRCVFVYCLSYLCLARRKVAMRKPAKIKNRVATFRVFAPKTRLYDMAQISHHTYTTGGKLKKLVHNAWPNALFSFIITIK